MTQQLTIEQLKFAEEIAATWRRDSTESWFKEIDGQCYVYIKVEQRWLKSTEKGHPSKFEGVYEIDFSPLDDYYADKAVDIAATGGGVLPDAANDPEFNGVPESSGEPITWPISEELIGRKVRFDGYVSGGHRHWDYVVGEEYLIANKYGCVGPASISGEVPSRNFDNDFKFTLIPEQEIPDGYYHDDESGKLKPLKPAPESAHDRLTAAVKAYRNELGLEGAYDPALVEAEKLLKSSVPSTGYDQSDVALKKPRSKYHREIKPGVWVDVYDVISAWGITNPAQQHLAKKALQAGDRGHKSYVEDMRDIIASAERAIDLFNDNERTAGVNE